MTTTTTTNKAKEEEKKEIRPLLAVVVPPSIPLTTHLRTEWHAQTHETGRSVFIFSLSLRRSFYFIQLVLSSCFASSWENEEEEESSTQQGHDKCDHSRNKT